MESGRLRLRLVCDASRQALIAELLAARALGPDKEASLALVERGMTDGEALALVFDPGQLEALPRCLDAIAGLSNDPLRPVALKGGDGIELVPLRTVLYFEAAGQSVRCFTPTTSGEVKERLYELEDRLPASRFARVSKSAIVNLGAVREVHPWFGRSLLLRFGYEDRQVEVSRSYVRVLKDRLGI
jgi:DNA-binding LytR/AlgR family response regulator